MMTNIKKTIFFLCCVLTSSVSYAYDFESNGFYYNITSLQDLTVDITSGDVPYTGSIVIPDSVRYANRCFKVTGIAERGFAYSSITDVCISKTIKGIKVEAFAGCFNLNDLTIPGTVEYLSRGVFFDCIYLRNLIIEDSDNSLYLEPGAIYAGGGSPFGACPLRSVYVGRTLLTPNTNANEGLFSNQFSLTDVVLGEKVSRINPGMFYKCASLQKIELPQQIKSVENFAFYGCTELSEVILNEGLEEISIAAFRDCNQIGNIVLPSTLRMIDELAFLESSNIKTIISKSQTPALIYETSFAGITYLTATLYVPTGTKALYEAATGWKDFCSIQETNDFECLNTFYKSIRVSASGGKLVIENDGPAIMLSVYSGSGAALMSKSITTGTTSIDIPSDNFYIVKVGEQTIKVAM